MPKLPWLSLLCTGGLLVTGWLSLTSPALMDLLWYSREAVMSGEWWRLLTGHLVHLSTAHLLLNGLVFALLAARAERLVGGIHLAALLIVMAAGIGLGLSVWVPQMGFYAGVSALNYGMLAWLALRPGGLPLHARLGRLRIGAAVLVMPALFALCAMQWRQGFSLVPAGDAVATVAWQAHLLGIGLAITIKGIIPGGDQFLIERDSTEEKEPTVPAGRSLMENAA